MFLAGASGLCSRFGGHRSDLTTLRCVWRERVPAIVEAHVEGTTSVHVGLEFS